MILFGSELNVIQIVGVHSCMANVNNIMETWFEVNSEALFLGGQVFRRGDLINSAQISEKLLKMLQWGMLIRLMSERKAA